jgi:amino acid adenylation domain-containing protein
LRDEIERALRELTPEQQQWLLLRLGVEETPAGHAGVQTGAAASGGPWPLSAPQQRLWLIEQLEPGNPAYHIAGALRLSGRLSVAALEGSINEIVRRHAVLRTVFTVSEGQPVQTVLPRLALSLRVVDLRGLPRGAQSAAARRLTREHARLPFALVSGPLLRGALLRLGGDRWVLLLSKHHIVSDGWSLGIFVRELGAHYAALRDARPSPLPEPATQYADFSAWQQEWLRGETLKGQLAYWKRRLAGPLPVLDLPTDFQRPQAQTYEGATERLRLPRELSEALRSLSRREGVTLYMTLLAAFNALLHRYTGQTDVLVGTSIANRNRTEIEGLIGYFVNTLVLRTDVSGEPSFCELLGRVRALALEAYANQDVPFEKVLEELQPERALSHTPLFQVFFNMLNYSEAAVRLPGLEVELGPETEVGSKFDLTLYAREEGGRVLFELVYNVALFSRARAAEMLEQLSRLLAGVVADPETRVAAFPLDTALALAVRPDPTERLDAGWPGAVPELFARQAERDPRRTAVEGAGRSWTYGDLNARSNRLAHRLLARGVGRQEVVAIYGHRSADLVCCLLGVLKAGAAFLILDPAYPPARLVEYLSAARPRAFLQTEEAGEPPRPLAEFVRGLDVHCRVPPMRGAGGGRPESFSAHPPTDPEVVFGPDDAACVGFTSGSTGRPKGVLGRHGPLTHFLPWQVEKFGMHEDDRYSLLSGLSSDLLQREVFTPLCLGARVCIPGEEELGSPARLASWMRRAGVSIAYLTPAMEQMLTGGAADGPGPARAVESLRYVFIGGDVLTRQGVARLRRLAPRATCVNSYGATETQRAVTMYVVPSAAASSGTMRKAGGVAKEVLPVGHGARDVQVLILNGARQLAGLGELGEIHFRSPHLAKGYIGDGELTRARFIANPFLSGDAARLYRTGDLGRYTLDGSVELLGRTDHQVKIRGFRVEAGEVEAALRRHASVREAVVAARADRSGEKRLVAYIVAREGAGPGGGELRRLLKESLPDYMIPTAFVALDALPVGPTGKVLRDALPEPDWAAPGAKNVYAEPRGETEAALARVWARVLGVGRVGANDNFFDLGGHSLLAIKLMTAVGETFGVRLPLRTLFESPTVAGLGRAVAARSDIAAGRAQAAPPPLPRVVPDPANRHEPFPLTDIQQAYWVGRHASYELGNVATHTYLELECDGLDLGRFEGAWRKLIGRHDMLRAVVLPDGRQQILESVPDYRVRALDLRAHGPREREAELLAVRGEMSHQVLQADRWPLFDLRASLLPGGRTRLHVSFDLLVGDAWSFRLLIRELLDRYEDPALRLPELELSYRDYVLAERGLRDSELYARARDYWLARLPELPAAPQLPLARAPSGVARPRFVRWSATLDAGVWLGLKSRARREGLTSSGLLLAAFAEVLGAWSRSRRFTLNLTLFSRLPLHPQVDRLVGDFTSITLLAVDGAAGGAFSDKARRIQEQLWGDLDQRYFSGLEVIRELGRLQGRPAQASMPVVFTSTLDLPAGEPGGALPSRLGEVIYSVSQTPQVWLDQQVYEHDGRLTYNWDAVEDLFPRGLVADMFEAYGRLLARLAEDDGCWSEARPQLVPERQLEQRAAVNATAAPVPDELLHTLFLKQAARRPGGQAVSARGLTLSYKELDARSRELGRELRRAGAGPETVVAVALEKGWEQVLAVLGVLRSGAAYLPLDPQLPGERLRRLIEHARAGLVVTRSEIDGRLPWPDGVRRLRVDELAAQGGGDRDRDDSAPAAVQDAGALAYLIYTSGSTGTPKGVTIEHGAAVNTVVDINRRFGVTSDDRVLAVSSLSFDLSVYDVLGTLAAGGTIVMPSAEDVRDPARLFELMGRERVTVWNSVPVLMQMVCEYAEAAGRALPASLRLVMLSGDWIPVTLPGRIRRLRPGAEVVSLGGATEAAIWSIYYRVGAVGPDWRSVPYGRPLANQRWHVLDETLRPCPVWVPGQLYIGGLGLARGYWRDEERTRESFIEHPLTGERLYRTGDLGRYLPDGEIEFLGREDLQVKVQGYRIELGEIEAALAEHATVGEAVVVAQQTPAGDRRLVAFVVAGPAQPPPHAAALRAFLAGKLPAYMVPAAFVTLDALPLTANGKVDRKSLAAHGVDAGPDAGQSPAREDGLSRRISRLVAGVLGLSEVGEDASLLDLGVNSVDVIRIANALERELGWRPSVEAFYRLPSVGGLATAYAERGGRGDGAAEGARYDLLTDADERAQFKKQRRGLRRGDEGRDTVQLPGAPIDEAARQRYARRRSHRQFSQAPVALADFGNLLGCLRSVELDGEPKHLYASAGGLYPVQSYLYVKDGRVAGLDGGTFYYHPEAHRLVSLAPGVRLDANVYGPFANRPVFDGAAFSLFLVARLSAIAPIYGEHAAQFATLEAGYMSQLLMTSAADNRLGLCPVGTLDFERVRHLFALEADDVLLHSFLGGGLGGDGRWTPFQEPLEGAHAAAPEREEGEF